MKTDHIRERTLNFAVDIFNFTKYLVYDRKEHILSKQLLRSGTSVGAQLSEAVHAESKADFIHKNAIAQKEINETIYWLKIMIKSKFEDGEKIKNLYNEANQILAIITTILKKLKSKNT